MITMCFTILIGKREDLGYLGMNIVLDILTACLLYIYE